MEHHSTDYSPSLTSPGHSLVIEEDHENSSKSAEVVEEIKDTLGKEEGTGPECLLNHHALFIQLDVLCTFPDNTYGWKEMSRWLKYEEKVEVSGRWSKPHLSTVPLKAFLQLRQLLLEDKISLMLDLKTHGQSWPVVKGAIVERITKDFNLSQKAAIELSSILLAPHKHKGRGGKQEKVCSIRSFSRNDYKSSWELLTSYPDHLTPQDLGPFEAKKCLRRKLPKHTEVANVWVGCVDFSSDALYLLVRFGDAMLVEEVSEVDLPTRLLFVALSNTGSLWHLHELARAVAVLLNDKVFCEVAHRAKNRDDLLTGVNDFIEDVCILPPSVWDPTTRLDPSLVPMTTEGSCNRLAKQQTSSHMDVNFVASYSPDDSLVKTNVLFGGLVKDVKRRYCQMKSDITDALSIQSISSIIFLFFACITPTVTFGGLMSVSTEGNMGIIEMLVAGSLCGMTYAIFSGQPLTIVGATGPLLVFESILYQLCSLYGITYLPMRFWTGLWTFLILMLIVAFDLSTLITYITRFTEESFSVLISLIFIGESLGRLTSIWSTDRVRTNVLHEPDDFVCHCNITSPDFLSHPFLDTLNEDCRAGGFTTENLKYDTFKVGRQCVGTSECGALNGSLTGEGCVPSVVDSVPDVFLLSTILLFGTFFVSICLKSLRSSSFFPQIVRRSIGDFGVVLSLALWTTIDYLLGINTDKLNIPTQFHTTNANRGWLVNPLLIDPWWMAMVAVFPACLSTILIFLDQHITALIVNKKENKLKKGNGYHLDIFVISIQVLFCSLFGLPWFCAATVRSITHVHSLVKVTEVNAPGEPVRKLGIREQRVTGFCVHLFMALSIFGAFFLRNIPMPVLYGVFFYMGVTSLEGIQFVDRVLLLLMPLSDQPDHAYLRHVGTKVVHAFTLVQVLCSVFMCLVQFFSATSVAFPLTLLILILARKLMERFFTQRELYWLDNLFPETTNEKFKLFK